jgi:ABC-type Na+ transport system ATPase subunit NatA
MIPPSAQREMSARAGSTVVEVAGSHSICVSQPAVVADLIEKAGKTTLVRILATLLRPDAGQGELLGLDVVEDSSKVREQLARFRSGIAC